MQTPGSGKEKEEGTEARNFTRWSDNITRKNKNLRQFTVMPGENCQTRGAFRYFGATETANGNHSSEDGQGGEPPRMIQSDPAQQGSKKKKDTQGISYT